MARSSKSSILIAHAITWTGAILCSLVLTYGAHGPAKHPKMLLICLLPLAGISIAGLRSKGASVKVLVAHGVLWGTGCAVGLTLGNTQVGENVPPIAATAILAILSAVSFGILANAKLSSAGEMLDSPE